MLTPREHQVAVLMCNGLSRKEIARELDITLETVRTHIHIIYQKTGLRHGSLWKYLYDGEQLDYF